jgi:translocation and assembly module TamB
MTNAPNGQGPEPNESSESAQPLSATGGNGPKQPRPWGRIVLVLGAIAVLTGAGGAWWAWIFVQQRLAPWAAQILSDTLQRPVELGDVEQVSPFGVRFGPSAVPATATDPDTLYIDAIHVGFNPLPLLFRRLDPRITITGAQLYVEQDDAGQWLDLDLDFPERVPGDDPFVVVNPTIVLDQLSVMALPYADDGETPAPLVVWEEVTGTINLTRRSNIPEPRLPEDPRAQVDAQQIRLDLQISPNQAGQVQAQVQGDLLQFLDDPTEELELTALDRFQGTLALDVEFLALNPLATLALASLPEALPLTVTNGEIRGAVEIELTPFEPPRVTGSAELSDGTISVENFEEPIDNIGARLRFQGNRIAVEGGTAQYGPLTARAGGLIDSRNGYDLTGEIDPFELADLTETFPIDLPVAATGTFRAEGTVTGPLADPEIQGRVLSTDIVTVDRVPFAALAATVTYTHPSLALTELTVEPLAGGSLTGTGSYTLGEQGELALNLVGTGLPADAIARDYGLPEAITLGTLALTADISGPLDDLTGTVNWQAPEGTYPTRGIATIRNSIVTLEEAVVQVAGGTLTATGTLAAGAWDADVVAQSIQLGAFDDRLQGDQLSGTAQLAGRLDDLSLTGIDGSGDLTAAIAGGTLTSQFTLGNGGWNAAVQGQGLNVAQFVPNAPVAALSTDAQFSGSVTDISLNTIRGDGTVGAAVAGGTVVSAFTLANGVWQADGQGQNLQLAQLSNQLRGTGAATFQLAGTLDDLSPSGIRGNAQITLSDGLATLARLQPQLAVADQGRSPLTAAVTWDGQLLRVDEARGDGLLARGTIQPVLSGPGAPGIGPIDLFIQARDYALATLPVPVPTALALAGRATFDGRLRGTPSDLNLAGSLALADLAVNELDFEPLLSGDVRFSSRDGLALDLQGDQDQIVANYRFGGGPADFRIQAGDSLAIGETEGDRLLARLYNFPLSLLGLPPANAARFGTLRGNVAFASASINLRDFSAVGQFDVASLGLGYVSIDRLFSGFTYANGIATLNNGEIRMVDTDGSGAVVDERIYQVAGQFGLTQQPQIQARLATERGTLQDVLAILKVTELADVGRSLEPPAGFIPRSQAEAEAILATVPAGDPGASLLNNLRRLSELRELEVIAERATRDQPLPPLADLRGLFRGSVNLSASLAGDVTADFDLEGQDWRWGQEFRADQVVARGRYQDGLLQLNPVRFASEVDGELAAITLVGTTAANLDDRRDRALTLTVENVPIYALEAPLRLPFPIAGRLNGQAVLRGSIVDPSVEGTLAIADGELNNKPIDLATADFTYAGARLNLESHLELVGAEDPLALNLEMPYRPAFVRRRPVDDTVLADVQVRDDGLALINLFTDRVSWEGGNGEVIANLRGTWDGNSSFRTLLRNLDVVNGYARLIDATLGIQALPDASLTNVNATVRLAGLEDGEGSVDLRSPTIVVDDFSGDFSDGQVAAQGVFPLIVPLTPEPRLVASEEGAEPAPVEALQQPLTLDLDDLAMNIKGLYNGEVNGRIVLGGSVLAGAQLGGQVRLSNGRISIPEGGNGTTASTGPSDDEAGVTIPNPRFSNLQVNLDRDVRVVQGTLLNVTARGSLLVNGLTTQPEPFGLIRLTSGRVSLLTTSLRLSGDNNQADFRGNLDPILRVSLTTAVPDTNTGSLLVTGSPFPRNEVNDVDVENIALTQGGIRTIRIRAEVDAPASQLLDIDGLDGFRRVVQLTSTPQRSETEIFSLLSGDVLTALGSAVSGEGNQDIGGAAGAVAISFLQNIIGDALPVDEFRLFPVTTDSGQVNESFDVGAEVGANISPSVAVSVLKVLTNATPFQFNVRYRINDQLTIRGTTSFEEFRERSGVLLEYETRF